MAPVPSLFLLFLSSHGVWTHSHWLRSTTWLFFSRDRPGLCDLRSNSVKALFGLRLTLKMWLHFTMKLMLQVISYKIFCETGLVGVRERTECIQWEEASRHGEQSNCECVCICVSRNLICPKWHITFSLIGIVNVPRGLLSWLGQATGLLVVRVF